MNRELAIPSTEFLESLPTFRQILVASFYCLSKHQEGVGYATAEHVETTYHKMIRGEMEESEWFALECQHQQIFAKCNELEGE